MSDAAGAAEAAPYYDPYDYAIDANPHPVWRRLRDEAPVYRNERLDFWALSRFADVFAASLDHETFSSAYGTVLELMSETPGESPMMIFRDPPAHTRLRKLVSRAFSPRRIGELEPRVRALCARFLDPQVGGDGFDYLAEFGAKLPVMVISSLLGVPEQDQDAIREWTDALLHREPGEENADRHAAISRELWGYFSRYVAERRARPRDDLISALMTAEVVEEDGSRHRLDDTSLLAFIGLISGAGNETVARFLGWAATLLARFPEQRRLLVREPGLVPNAVEELLRYDSSVQITGRVTHAEVELGGVTIGGEQSIVALLGAANRDPAQYRDPDRLDVGREHVRPMSFGGGIHHCLGAQLARLEAELVFAALIERMPNLTLPEKDAPAWRRSFTLRGLSTLPAVWH